MASSIRTDSRSLSGRSQLLLWLRTLVLASLVLLGVACSRHQPPNLRDTVQATGVPNPGFAPLITDGTVAEFAHGVWTSPGYGRILEVTGASVRVFHLASTGVCLPDPTPSQEIMALLTWARRDGTTLLISPTLRSAPYRLELQDSLPQQCKQSPERSATATFDYFAATMAEYYAFFDLHGVDWSQRVELARAQLTDEMSDNHLFEVLTGMLEGLDDGHLSLEAEIDGEERNFSPAAPPRLRQLVDGAFERQSDYTDGQEFRQAWIRAHFKNIKEHLLVQARSEQGNSVVWGMVRGTDVGYIHIRDMTGYSPTGLPIDGQLRVDAIMAKVLGDLENASRMILDVTFNRGGEDEISAAFASHFAGRAALAYTKAPAGQGSEFASELFVRPSVGPRFTGPVALVTSNYTVSAAEIFVLYLRALDNVTHYGAATAGALSDVLEKPLPNGWSLGLSNEIYLDPQGQHWEKHGIPPQQEFTLFEQDGDIFESHWRAIRRLALQLEKSTA